MPHRIRLLPIGESFVNGLSSSYDDTYPTLPAFQEAVSKEEFDSSIKKINEALMDHWPCLPCYGFAYGCCICTLGLSLFCSSSMVAESESRAKMQIRRINEQSNYRWKGVEWELKRTWCPRRSFIEITIKNEENVASL